MRLSKNILQEILFNDSTVCCLCLDATGEDAFCISDDVSFDSGLTLDLFSMIDSIFQIKKIEYISRAVCKDCVKSIISSYTFIAKCTEVNEKITSAFCNFTNSLEKIDNEDLSEAKIMYIAADSESLQSKTYYDTKRATTSKSVVLKRFQTLHRSALHKTKINTDIDVPFLSQGILCECGKTFPTRSSFNRHTKEHCKLNKIKKEVIDGKPRRNLRKSCKYCGSSCSNRYFLKKHLLNCKEFKEKVPEEDTTNTTKRLVNKQERLVNKEERLVNKEERLVNEQERLVNRQESYQRKTNQLHQNERVSCDYCSQSFRSKYILSTHINNHCKNAPLEYKSSKNQSLCSQCGKVVSKGRMAIHESTHLPHFVCSKCGKRFKTEKCYKKHLLIPNCIEKPLEYVKPTRDFSCHYCGSQFVVKRYLAAHIKARHSDCGYECHLCKKRLSTKYALKFHMLVHTKEKNFECDICGGKFVSKHSLLYHTRTHTGETPYKCKFCDQRFLSASRRNGHIRIHHLPPQLQCKHCPKKFSNWGTRNTHTKRHFNPKSSLYLGNLSEKVRQKRSK